MTAPGGLRVCAALVVLWPVDVAWGNPAVPLGPGEAARNWAAWQTALLSQDRPWTFSLLAGVDAYPGQPGSHLRPGYTGGAALGFEPLRCLGFELGYARAESELIGVAPGGGLVRNAVWLGATPGLTLGRAEGSEFTLKVYLFGGLALDAVSAPAGGLYAGGVAGDVPVGGGLRARVWRLVSDVRLSYDATFGGHFAAGQDNLERYRVQLSLGAAL